MIGEDLAETVAVICRFHAAACVRHGLGSCRLGHRRIVAGSAVAQQSLTLYQQSVAVRRPDPVFPPTSDRIRYPANLEYQIEVWHSGFAALRSNKPQPCTSERRTVAPHGISFAG